MGCQLKDMKLVEVGFHANVAQEADLAVRSIELAGLAERHATWKDEDCGLG